jgi:Flp pilus assembly protein TadG
MRSSWQGFRAFGPKGWRTDQAGSTAVEIAFVGPLAILLTFGAVETGRALFAEAAITQAAKETARFASVRGTASGAAATEAELEAMALQLADLSVRDTSAAVSWDPDNSPGGVVTVTIQHDFTPLTLPFAGRTFTFDATASMTVTR